jgi:hypothetical protein
MTERRTGEPESMEEERRRVAEHFVLEGIKSSGGSISPRVLESMALGFRPSADDVRDASWHLMAGYPIEGQFGGAGWNGDLYLIEPQAPQDQTKK